jgi:hypothetical protein
MRILLSVLLSLISIIAPPSDALATLSDQEPPTAHIVTDDFSPMRESWQPVSGQWAVANGTYGDSLAGSTDITIITDYRAIDPSSPPIDQIQHEDFFMRARMRNQGTSDAHLVGLVYGYQDSQNYYEVVVSALGTVTMRTVMNGIAVDEVPSIHRNIPRNTWLEVEVRWNRGVASLKIDGSNAYTAVSQPEFTSGDVGLVTHSAVGRFDKVFLGVPFGDQSFLEMFDEPPFVAFAPQSGQWSVVDGSYRNSAIQQTSITLAPIHPGVNITSGDTGEYTFRARMLNPYANSGNLVGIVFNYGGSRYAEVVFSPTGVAKLNLVENGVVRTLATANYGGTRNVAFDVHLQNRGPDVSVIVGGNLIFDRVDGVAEPGQPAPEGGVGLITHWAPGRFDNVQFDHGTFRPCSTNFATLPPDWIVSGTWDANGGTLNDTSAGQTDIVNLKCLGNSSGEDAGTDEVYSARLLNQYGGSGNLVGLIYNYQDSNSFYAGDYFEVVFSPTGIMQLNKFIQGVRYPVRTLTHNIPSNTWFNVQVIRSGIHTAVQLNGTTVLSIQPQGELRGGSVGVITHWAKARFDDARLQQFFSRPPSEL